MSAAAPPQDEALNAIHLRHARRWLGRILLLVLLLGTIAYLALPVLTIGLLAEKNYNEGWNAYHAARAAAGAVLYDDDLRRVVNYPFLSFYAAAPLAQPLGGVLFAGRILSLVGLLGTGLACGVIAARLGATRAGILFSAIASIGFAILAAPGWIAADDPQALAEALMLAGLAVYLGGRDNARHLALAAALILLGGFTKHTLVAVPIAVTIDIALRSPRRLLLWAGLCLLFFAALLAATMFVAGGDFFARLFSPRVIAWDGLVYHPRKFLIMFKLPLLVSAIWLAGFAPRDGRLLLGLYLGSSVLTGSLFGMGEGVSYNTLFDAAVALGLVSGLAFDGFAKREAPSLAGRLALFAVPVLLAWPMLVRSGEAVRTLAGLGRSVAAARAEDAALRADAAFLASRPGDAICESLLLCFAGGKPLLLDPFNSRQMMLAGRLDESRLVAEIAAQRYAAIQVRDVILNDPASPDRINPALHFPARFTDAVLRAIAQSYHVEHVSAGRVIYLPNGASL